MGYPAAAAGCSFFKNNIELFIYLWYTCSGIFCRRRDTFMLILRILLACILCIPVAYLALILITKVFDVVIKDSKRRQ